MTGKGKTKKKNKKRKEGRRRPRRRHEREKAERDSDQEMIIRAIQKNDPSLVEVEGDVEEPIEVSVEVKTPDTNLESVLKDMRQIGTALDVNANVVEGETESETEIDAEPEEKFMDGAVPVVAWTPFGGAETWDDLDEFLEAADFEQTTRQATFEFGQMVGTVLGNTEHDLAEKGRRVAALANGLTERAEDLRDEKDILVEEGEIDIPESLTFLTKLKETVNRLRGENVVIGAKAEVEPVGVTSFSVFKDKDGRDRWFGWVSNRWRDQDTVADPEHGGEILTDDSHKDFVAWVDQNPEKRMPQLWPWHTKELAHKYRADWIDYTHGFLLMSGPLEKEEAEKIADVADTWDLGMSHGFYAISREKEGGLITKYRSFEVSYLPIEFAANQWTDFVTIMKEVKVMSDTKRQLLQKIAPEGFIEELEPMLSKTEALIDGLDVDTKGADGEGEGETEVTPESEVEVVAEAEVETEADADAETVAVEAEVEVTDVDADEEPVEKDPVDSLREEVGEAIGVIGGEVKVVADLVKGLVDKANATEEEEAEVEAERKELTPAASLVALAKSAIGQEKTKVEEDDELGKKGPEEAEPNDEMMMGVPLLHTIKRQNIEYQEQQGRAPGGKFSVSSG